MRKIKECLVILYFFICPCELVLNKAITSSTKYVGILIFAFWIIDILYNFRNTQFDFAGHTKALLLWLGMCLLSLAWGNNSELTMPYLITYLEMGLLVILLIQVEWSEKEIRRFLFAYYFGSVCLSMAVMMFGETRFMGRATIVFMGRNCDPNQVAANIIPGALISLYYSINGKIKKVYRLFSAFTFLLTIYTIFLTGSRGGLLGIGVGVLFTYFLQERGTNFNKFLYMLFFAALVWFALSLMPKETTDRILAFDTYTDTYSNGENRLTIWRSLLKTFDAQWMIGHGVGGSIAYFVETVGIQRSVHNTFLLVLYEVGILGFGCFLFPYISMLFNNIRRRNSVFAGILLASLVSAFFLDSLNFRYIWNGLVLCVMKYNCEEFSPEAKNEKIYGCKYIKTRVDEWSEKESQYII